MSISAVSSSATPQAQAPRVAPRDADGDNDGTRAVAKQAAPAPQIAKPTATLGNRLNVQA
jgi:hypothetical protein